MVSFSIDRHTKNTCIHTIKWINIGIRITFESVLRDHPGEKTVDPGYSLGLFTNMNSSKGTIK